MQAVEKFIEINGARIHYLEQGSGKAVVLHHGARFNARTWEEVGTISTIADAGFRAISIDFPGFGKSTNGKFNSLSEFIGSFVDEMKLEKPVLLGASMGGEAVLEYSVDNPGKIGGLILVGAVGVSNYEEKLKSLDGIPILLIWGRKDSVSSKSNAELILKYVKTAKFVNVGNQHACYLDDPAGFNTQIREYLKGL
ncbi:2-hydroxy-6-oxo-6-phenylhexa-2,4-dienoate hydrolase [Candidatus Acidianus copahuensis]|uniref:2-hydroxy-6-oxo-6-phenylhexa-2,4-dienoate hydrolase n=2 Tax=Candidatus Acidianus copahuensis TaxID=1160895 RepID=A0A031LKV1_9CREN|nr:2-hydroxy-6-oxo-6-phenylhexa-2,4-dienoate hydrolase [Candidatus Acidianus copahuensis]